MEPIYEQEYFVNDAAVDCFGRLKPSMLLFYCQDVAGSHCIELGTDYDTMADLNLFWAITRVKVQINRLPRSGEFITVKTWPMPTTRVCYPRSTVAYDRNGNELFRAIALWVLMDLENRTMVLPGKSGVTVEGLLTGTELATPGSLSPKTLSNVYARNVAFSDLDRNGHMNNTRYLEWMGDLLPSSFHRSQTPREFTVCYHNEAREGQKLRLHWQLDENATLLVDAHRDAPETGSFQRVFSAQIQY